MAEPIAMQTKSILPSAWKVPAVFRARLGEGPGRQRAMESQGHLLLVLHEPPLPGEPERRGRFFWREPDGSWKSSGLGAGVQALRAHLAHFADRVDKLDDELQRAAGANDFFLVLQAIAPLHRTTRNLHAALQQAREMVPGDRELIVLRDRAGEIERAAELLHTDTKNGLDFMVAFKAEEEANRSYEMAVSAHRLNLMAALFFPIATLGAIFGMNLEHHVQFWGKPWDFLGILGVGFFGGLLLTGVIAARPTPVAKVKRRRTRDHAGPAHKDAANRPSHRPPDGPG